MAARIIFCTEGVDGRQDPSMVWNLVEGAPPTRRSKSIVFSAATSSASPSEHSVRYRVCCADADHKAVLQDAVVEQAKPDSTACFIVLLEDHPRHDHVPVFHAERVNSAEIQASFDESWAQLQQAGRNSARERVRRVREGQKVTGSVEEVF
ncbi:MAG: hypothetical protein KME20_26875 [Kaiparowitsia implicata GSE-PSE-MK54-09C]|jgi:hypothetical protein|nr:hypothetical protein [Kaiparowitsia implicata GSE-PSE-MK54-09C]